MILDSGHATAVPPSANINRHLPISIATRPALNWDHHRCKGEKNITPQPAGLARGVGCLYAAIPSLSGRSGHYAPGRNRSPATQSGRCVGLPAELAVQKNHVTEITYLTLACATFPAAHDGWTRGLVLAAAHRQATLRRRVAARSTGCLPAIPSALVRRAVRWPDSRPGL